MGCSSPQGRVTHVSVGDDVVFGEGGFDYGYRVRATVENTGETRGHFVVEATLSCTEGLYRTQRDLLLESGDEQSMTFFFDEPTVESEEASAIVAIIGASR
jgi:hypothetical protein